jgi:hypothetical protein
MSTTRPDEKKSESTSISTTSSLFNRLYPSAAVQQSNSGTPTIGHVSHVVQQAVTQHSNHPDAAPSFLSVKSNSSNTSSEGQDPWALNWPLALVHGVGAGFAVPIATTPLVQMEAMITAKHMTFEDALKRMLKHPFKGYPVLALTNTLRCSLLFGATPWMKSNLEIAGLTQTNAKIAAFGLVGCTEGVIMSARFPLMQMLHTSDIANARTAFKSMWSAEGVHRWSISCRYGVGRDLLFWPIYAAIVDKLEDQLHIYKQAETAAKWEEEFVVGATAGFLGSMVSFPVHAALRRRLENINVTLKQDFVNAWKVHGSKQNGGFEFLRGHAYKGFLSAAIIMPVAMGTMNLAKHLGNLVYNSYVNKTGLFKAFAEPVKAVEAPVVESDRGMEQMRFLMKMGSN